VWTPKKLNKDEKALLAKLKDSSNFAPNPAKEERNFFDRMKECFHNNEKTYKRRTVFLGVLSFFFFQYPLCGQMQECNGKGIMENPASRTAGLERQHGGNSEQLIFIQDTISG